MLSETRSRKVGNIRGRDEKLCQEIFKQNKQKPLQLNDKEQIAYKEWLSHHNERDDRSHHGKNIETDHNQYLQRRKTLLIWELLFMSLHFKKLICFLITKIVKQ